MDFIMVAILSWFDSRYPLQIYYQARFGGLFLYLRHARRISTTEPFGGELTEWSGFTPL